MKSAAPRPIELSVSALGFFSSDGTFLVPLHLSDAVAEMGAAKVGVNVSDIIAGEGYVQQWVEGPAASVAMLWDRIQLEARHRVVWTCAPAVVTARHFPGSPLQLAITLANLSRHDPTLIEDDPRLPNRIEPAYASIRTHMLARKLPCWPGHSCGGAASKADAAGLTSNRAQDLSDLLTKTDPVAARRALDEVMKIASVPIIAYLVQTVLDDLQAGWMAGHTSALQRHLAVTMLQSALRVRLDIAESPNTTGSALVVLLPGTLDMCGVMLKVALLRRAGWSVRLLLAQSGDEILNVADGLQPDLVVLAGSQLFTSQGELCLLADILPALSGVVGVPIIVGGKLAQTHPHIVLACGADAVCGGVTWIVPIAEYLAEAPCYRRPNLTSVAKPGGQTILAERALATVVAGHRSKKRRT